MAEPEAKRAKVEEKPKAEEPQPKEPTAEAPTAEEPKTEEPTPEEPKPEEPQRRRVWVEGDEWAGGRWAWEGPGTPPTL